MQGIARLKDLLPPAGKRLQFWWPLCISTLVLGMLWAQIPFRIMLGCHPAGLPRPLPVPSAAYVKLDDDFAARAFHRIRSSWSSDDQIGKTAFDIELSEAGSTLPAPWQLTKCHDYSDEWHPAPIPPLKMPEQNLSLPVATEPTKPPPVSAAFHVTLSPALDDAGFAFEPPEEDFSNASGSVRFEVETDSDGRVVHLLSLSEPSTDQRRLEAAIIRGRAAGPAGGFVTCEWHFTSAKNKSQQDGE